MSRICAHRNKERKVRWCCTNTVHLFLWGHLLSYLSVCKLVCKFSLLFSGVTYHLVLTNYCKLRHWIGKDSQTNKWGLLHFEYSKGPRCPPRLLCEHLKWKTNSFISYCSLYCTFKSADHYSVLSQITFCTTCQMVNIEYGNVVLIFFRPECCPENTENCISGHLNFKHFWVSMTQTNYAKTRAIFYGNKIKCKAQTFLGFLFLHFCVN